MIRLASDTIDKQDIKQLCDWLQQDPMPQLTKGLQTLKFEERFASWIGSKHAISVNSGSSANLLMIYALIQMKMLKNKKIVVPEISWATTISPIIHFNLNPIICDIDLSNLGCNLESLEDIFRREQPACLVMVNVLGFPNRMKEIMELCKRYEVILLEDSCETMGSEYEYKKCGTFGLMGSFSTFYSHFISQIEGGILVTDNDELYDMLIMLRSHGWTRDLSRLKQDGYKTKYGIDDFMQLYSFYVPGFNVRSTDLQAKIGLLQMEKIDNYCSIRKYNFDLLQTLIKNDFWKPSPPGNFISNMAYPIISPFKNKIVKALMENQIECRPLVAGSMSQQPFIKELGIKNHNKNAKIINEMGLYIPNHQNLTIEDIQIMVDVVNGVING